MLLSQCPQAALCSQSGPNYPRMYRVRLNPAELCGSSNLLATHMNNIGPRVGHARRRPLGICTPRGMAIRRGARTRLFAMEEPVVAAQRSLWRTRPHLHVAVDASTLTDQMAPADLNRVVTRRRESPSPAIHSNSSEPRLNLWINSHGSYPFVAGGGIGGSQASSQEANYR